LDRERTLVYIPIAVRIIKNAKISESKRGVPSIGKTEKMYAMKALAEGAIKASAR